MRELNKKKVEILVIVAVLIINLIVVGIIMAVNKGESKDNNTDNLNTSQFSNMKAQSLKIRYDEEKNQTYVDLIIKNHTEQNVEKETVNVMLLSEDNQIISGIQTYIEVITPGDEYSINITLLGNITGIKKVSLQRPDMAIDA